MLGWVSIKTAITRLEKALADFQVELFRQARYFSSGVEPLLGYLLAKQNELKDLRFILVGKLNNVPAERLKERLSVCY